VHIGAKFTQYTAEFEKHGTLAPADDQRFVYTLEGKIAGPGLTLEAGEYAWFPPDNGIELQAISTVARASIIEKRYQPLPGIAPPTLFKGNESQIEPSLLMGDADLEVRSLIPANPAFDLAVKHDDL
jgi:(S)-ureidoglycine aminohydrolase